MRLIGLARASLFRLSPVNLFDGPPAAETDHGIDCH
jgi:hypothetical protein